MDICWKRADLLAFRLCFLYAVLIVCVPFPCGVWGSMWNSIVSVPDHCLFIYFTFLKKIFTTKKVGMDFRFSGSNEKITCVLIRNEL